MSPYLLWWNHSWAICIDLHQIPLADLGGREGRWETCVLSVKIMPNNRLVSLPPPEIVSRSEKFPASATEFTLHCSPAKTWILFYHRFLSEVFMGHKNQKLGQYSGGSKGAQILSISCSFWENMAKLYVGAPLGELAPPPREILHPPLQ